MGHGANGGFTASCSHAPGSRWSCLPHFPWKLAALSEPFAAAIQAVTEVKKVRIGDIALVSTAGDGLLCLKLLVAEGVKTIVAGTHGDEVQLEAAVASERRLSYRSVRRICWRPFARLLVPAELMLLSNVRVTKIQCVAVLKR